jgi:hypothetical protein
MPVSLRTALGAGLAVLLLWAVRITAASAGAREVGEIEAFNKRFEEVTLRMDNAGAMALWADNGVTLLPGMAPLAGKKTIAKWLDDLAGKMPG